MLVFLGGMAMFRAFALVGQIKYYIRLLIAALIYRVYLIGGYLLRLGSPRVIVVANGIGLYLSFNA